MKKIAILVEDLYHELEMYYPYFRLKEAGFAPVIVGTGDKKEYVSKNGVPVKEERSIKDVKPGDFEGVIVPGGFAPDKLRKSREVLDLVRSLFVSGKLVASICHGPWVLISAGVLKGKKSTSCAAIIDDVKNAGSLFEDSEVVVDGNLITSRAPNDLPAFMKAILGFLGEA